VTELAGKSGLSTSLFQVALCPQLAGTTAKTP